jgi:hypothetical protein
MKKNRYRVSISTKTDKSKIYFDLEIDEYTYKCWKSNPNSIKNLLYENLKISFRKMKDKNSN